jgi:hypothetical protein
MHRILRQALQQAVRWRMLAYNPADLVKPSKVERQTIATAPSGPWRTRASRCSIMTPLRVRPVATTRKFRSVAAQFHVAARVSLRREPSDLFIKNALIGAPAWANRSRKRTSWIG